MSKPYVFITRKLPKKVLQPLLEIAEVDMWESEEQPVPIAVLNEKAKQADGLLTMLSDQVTEKLLFECNKLKVVANLAVGYNNIDVDAASKKGIYVCNTPDVLTETTADLVFALLLATARRIIEAADFIKEGNWQDWSPFLLAGQDVHHKTIGIVGMGRIGEAVAQRAKGFNMNIKYHNRSRRVNVEEQLGAEYSSFDKLLQQSDFVVCLTPLTSETNGMFNQEAFQKMKGNAIFINASRGQVVDEAALYRAIVEKQIAGAGLDVFEKEPIKSDHPLLSLPNVVALPHIGSASHETRMKMCELAVENIVLALNGAKPKTSVNKG